MTNKITIKKILLYWLIYISIVWIVFLIWIKSQYLLSSFYFWMNWSSVNKDIVVVALDKKTLTSTKFKRFQDINRADYATLIRHIGYWDPKVIWVDVFFLHESQDESQDRELKEILEKNDNVIIASEIWDWTAPSWVFMWDDFKNYWYIDTVSLNDIDIFNLHLNDYKNKLPIVFDGINPSIPMSVFLFKKAYWYDNVKVDLENSTMSFDDKYIVPLQSNWNWENKSHYLNINYFTNNYKVVSFIDVLENLVDSNVFKDKIVLVWATAQDIHDEFLSPYDTSNFMPWVFILANWVNTLSSWKILTYQTFPVFITINALLFLIVMIALIRIKRHLIWIFISWATFIAFLCLSLFLYFNNWYFLEIFPTLVWFILLNSIIFFIKYFEEYRNKNRIQSMFSKYVSKDVVDQIVDLWVDNLSLWWSEKAVTIFFSDLVWFTDLSEKLNAQQLGKILNIYFENMSNIILNLKGTIDKFMWDAIMAFWNAPFDVERHESLACEAALLQRQSLWIIREEIIKMWVDSNIDMRIWINTWNVVVWNFWCSKRYDYTILWDNVNLASRLESINKQYETRIILSENTYKNIDHSRFVTREIDLITVKWKEHPVRIYELVWFVGAVDKSILDMISVFEKWLKYYRERNFIQAIELFKSIDDWVARLFILRCQEFLDRPPEANWDNVYRFKVK